MHDALQPVVHTQTGPPGLTTAGPLPQSQATSHWSVLGAGDRPEHASSHEQSERRQVRSAEVSDTSDEQPGRFPRFMSSFAPDTVVATADVVDSSGRDLREDWKYLRQAPELVVTAERTWERCLALDLWLQQISICASAVSKGMEQHWASVVEQARAMYTRTQSLSVADRVGGAAAGGDELGVSFRPGFAQHENKLLVILMAVLPSEVKRPLLEAHPNHSPTSVELIHQALEWFGPGGREDCRSFLEFVRKPGGNFSSVSECRARLRL